MNNKEIKKKYNKQKRDFLLTFFDKDEYQEKEINGFWLVKSWDGNNKRWQVGIFTKESLDKMNKWKKGKL